MHQRPIGRSSSLVHCLAVFLSIATAVISILILKQKTHDLSRSSIISLITGELLSVLSLPLLLFNSKTALWGLFTLGGLSTALSLGAGLALINNLISSNIVGNMNPKLLTSLLSLIVSSQLLHGLSLSTHLHSIQDFSHLFITEQEKHDIDSLKEKVVTLKASAATLVESRKTSGNQESVVNHQSIHSKNNQNSEQQSSIFQSTKSRFSSKVSLNSSNDVNKSNKLSIPSYSIKKLSMINQSSSSTNISIAQSHQPTIETTTTPIDTNFKSALTAKNLILERDALRRIPSALLPPHLKPQTKQEQQQQSSKPQPSLMIKTSQSQSNLTHGTLKENIPESIPRAATFSNIFTNPPFELNNGMTTITPTDYENSYENFQFNQLRAPIEPSKRLMKSAHFGEFSSAEEEGEDKFSLSEDEEDVISNNGSEVSNKSTEEALKFVQDAHEKGSNEFIRDVIDQSKSTLQLERVTTPTTLTKSKSHSPHKSIFKSHHNRKDSSTSVSFKNFSVSMPSSPRRKSIINSPKKLRIKNLSLSSIVFKDTEEELPNLSYVHELQSSPSKKRRASVVTTTPTKNKHFDNILAEKSNTTPESNWSENSHKSVFPSEVIGEYDKEKWKTMERLHLVKQQETLKDEAAGYPGPSTAL